MKLISGEKLAWVKLVAKEGVGEKVARSQKGKLLVCKTNLMKLK